MMRVQKLKWIFAPLLICLMLGLTACSDDTSAGEGANRCNSGERFNSIKGICEQITRNDNNPPSNDARDDQNLDPSDTPDAGPSGDGGAENPGQPGSDAGSQNPGDPDAGDAQSADSGHTPPDAEEPAACGPGAIIGKACAPSGALLRGATVTVEGVDCDGQPFTLTAETNRNGEYEFQEVPSGVHALTVATGSFSGENTVIVSPGQTSDLTLAAAKICLDASNVQIAVIKGAYDSVEALLDDLHLTYDFKGDDGGGGLLPGPITEAKNFLTNLAEMQQYDIIFINCGQLWNRIQMDPAKTAIINNLRAYLNTGGSLYASDWAHAFVETVFPDMVDFYGNDANLNEALFGYAPQSVAADVLSAGLQSTLGHNQTVISFPHDPGTFGGGPVNNNWAVAEGAGPESTVHLHGAVQLCAAGASNCDTAGATIQDAPLLVSYVTPGGGTVFFTSFHNDRQVGLSRDMEEILKFLIFQL